MRTTERTNTVARRRAGFTLFEMLVVMGIILALLTAMAPTLSGLLKSNRRANAINTLTATLSRARSIAIERNRPTGIVFLFDVQTKKTTLIIAQLRSGANGKLQDSYWPPPKQPIATDSFVLEPAENVAPVVLPEDVLVYALSFHHELEGLGVLDPEEWSYPDEEEHPYFPPYFGEMFRHPNNTNWFVNPWILPHNDPRLFLDEEEHLDPALFRTPERVDLDQYWTLVDENNTVDGLTIDPEEVHETLLNAHSFVIMFGSDGVLKPVIDTGTGSSMVNYYLEFPDGPIDAEPDDTNPLQPYDVSTPGGLQNNFNPISLGAGARLDINVPSPNPEVMLRPANMLAVVELSQIVRGTGVTEPWELHSSTAKAPWPMFRGTPDTSVAPLERDDPELDQIVLDVSNWIDVNGAIIAFDPNTGNPQRRGIN